ncbi:hypothetical protein DL89DRAFT_302405 [Linderina pennispora]|uniref:Uncharacterized protein n=1 Tax=Linderina pennispora TaxID=61395 RepID=A0A1Y1VSR5_9FUNG|nr:uncharacterized protein DL89DRAFT_302405 [Linderina pennispora]ORX64317.1 hypothetical protein DL89DRAFT_302405 [Linderina pennispora]
MQNHAQPHQLQRAAKEMLRYPCKVCIVCLTVPTSCPRRRYNCAIRSSFSLETKNVCAGASNCLLKPACSRGHMIQKQVRKSLGHLSSSICARSALSRSTYVLWNCELDPSVEHSSISFSNSPVSLLWCPVLRNMSTRRLVLACISACVARVAPSSSRANANVLTSSCGMNCGPIWFSAMKKHTIACCRICAISNPVRCRTTNCMAPMNTGVVLPVIISSSSTANAPIARYRQYMPLTPNRNTCRMTFPKTNAPYTPSRLGTAASR